jgi:hypothetical protein
MTEILKLQFLWWLLLRSLLAGLSTRLTGFPALAAKVASLAVNRETWLPVHLAHWASLV